MALSIEFVKFVRVLVCLAYLFSMSLISNVLLALSCVNRLVAVQKTDPFRNYFFR